MTVYRYIAAVEQCLAVKIWYLCSKNMVF